MKKKKIARGLSVRFIIAVLLFCICYASGQGQIPQSLWLNNQIAYSMKHNSDIHTIINNSKENVKILIDTVMTKVSGDDKDM